MAYQALEGILKLSKPQSKKEPLSELVPDMTNLSNTVPGVREDNTVLQYKGGMERAKVRWTVEAYWARPFVVKSYVVYFAWPSNGKARIIFTASNHQHKADSWPGLISEFFLEEG